VSGAVPLGDLQVAATALLLLVAGSLSVLLSLGLERRLAVAAVRMTVQLVLMGVVLTALFRAASPYWTALMALVMVLFAGHEIAARQDRKLAGWWGRGLGTGSMLVGAGSATVLALAVILRPRPWWDPRYAIPLFGMMLGNAMTGISLGLDGVTTAAVRERAAIEAQIALGAERLAAFRPVMREAVRRGFTPILNSMAAAGVVTLPGMMTGQILVGAPPGQAVRYQLLIMFLLGGSTGLGVFLAVLGTVWRLTDERHRLRLDRLRAGPEGRD
jgi:putative ABC transport system permease protein